MNKQALAIAIIVIVTLAGGGWLLTLEPPAMTAEEAEAAEAAFERGPHNGRLLRSGDFALEVTIFESGVPPEFHIYPYMDGAPAAPQDVDLTVTLTRLGGVTDVFKFSPSNDYLLGGGTVHEPHSFAVRVEAAYRNQKHAWSYESYEGRTQIDERTAIASGVATETAGPGQIRSEVMLTGRIVADPDRVSQVRARFPGIVREVRKTVGDTVRASDVLALIESNDNLQTYQLRSPIAGRIVSRTTAPGDVAGEQVLFEIADVSQVLAEFSVFPRHAGTVREGQAVTVRPYEGDMSQQTEIQMILPVADPVSQAVPARAVLDNADGFWRAGMTVLGAVTVGVREVPLAVKVSGLQSFRDFTVVYAKVDDTYEVRMLELGDSDGERVEVLGGLQPGTEYVSENSYLIKADIEKSGASHDH